MATLTIRNPRLTASAELEIKDGPTITLTVDRDATPAAVLDRARAAIQEEAARRTAAGEAPVRIPPDEELVPALKSLLGLTGQWHEV